MKVCFPYKFRNYSTGMFKILGEVLADDNKNYPFVEFARNYEELQFFLSEMKKDPNIFVFSLEKNKRLTNKK